MPIPQALIYAGTALGGYLMNYLNQQKAQDLQAEQNAINMRYQTQNNQAQIDFIREQMQTQRNWAVDDWQRNNLYNHPAQQMKRFAEAGLNPHLIYGNMNNSPAAMIRGVDAQKYTPEAPRYEIDGYLKAIQMSQQNNMAIADAIMQQKQLELMDAQKDLVIANTLKANSNVDLNNFNIENKKYFQSLQADLMTAQREALNQKIAESKFNVDYKDMFAPHQINKLRAEAQLIKANTKLSSAKLTTEQLLQDVNSAKLRNMMTPEQARLLHELKIGLTQAEKKLVEEKYALYLQQKDINQFEIDYLLKLKAAGMTTNIILDIIKAIRGK
jgi:hypothetical protein